MSEEKIVEKKEVKETKMDTSKIHIFNKIQNVRVELQQMDLKKTGYNKYSDFFYFDLGDFLPQINELCLKYHLFTYEDITTEMARITVVDCDNLETTFVLVIPTAEVELKGANKIQSLGGLLTYARKYLYMLMFEIVEGDLLDAEVGKPETKSKEKKSNTKQETSEVLDNKTIMKNMCTELSKNGKKDEVMKILTDIASVKNPNSIQDEDKITKIIEELKKLEAL